MPVLQYLFTCQIINNKLVSLIHAEMLVLLNEQELEENGKMRQHFRARLNSRNEVRNQLLLNNKRIGAIVNLHVTDGIEN